MTEWIFITGGSGYIGSHVAAQLKEQTDYSVMIIDRRAKFLPHTTRFCDLVADEDFVSPVVKNAIRDYKPKAIIHLAANSTVGPSMTNPSATWDNNVIKTLDLLECCYANNINNIVFASSSGVYADQDYAVDETSPLLPYSPYATTKMVGEMMLKDWYGAHGLRSISFRFFNVAGSHKNYNLGELNGSSHLLAKIMESLVHGTDFTVFGRDWETADKTAIRDYTHVMDIADACVKAVNWLPNNPGAHIINLGGGTGHSVQQVIDTTESLLSKELPYRYGPRRDGDSVKRFSNNQKAFDILGWRPQFSLTDMILDSYKWYNSQMYQTLTQSHVRYE